MFKKKVIDGGLILIWPVVFISCINLQHVGKFAAASVKTLSSQEDIGYSFTRHCEEFVCNKEIYHIPVISRDFGNARTCNCDTFQMADQTLDLFNSVLTAYLTGLAELSDGKAVNYNFDNLIEAVNVDAIKSKLPITSNDITSLGKLATIISNDLVDLYRKRKLKEIIKKSNADFNIVISTYQKCMKNFFRDIILENGYSITLPDLYSTYFKTNDALLSPLEKARVYEEYLDKRARFEQYKALTTKYIAALDKVKEGHNELNKESEKLTDSGIKQIVNRYSTDIEVVITEFKKLKKSNRTKN